jgi:hypothetical protein
MVLQYNRNSEDNKIKNRLSKCSSLLLLTLLSCSAGKELRLNEGNDTTLADDDMAEKLVQLFIVLDRELQMTRHNTGLLVITSGVA